MEPIPLPCTPDILYLALNSTPHDPTYCVMYLLIMTIARGVFPLLKYNSTSTEVFVFLSLVHLKCPVEFLACYRCLLNICWINICRCRALTQDKSTSGLIGRLLWGQGGLHNNYYPITHKQVCVTERKKKRSHSFRSLGKL